MDEDEIVIRAAVHCGFVEGDGIARGILAGITDVDEVTARAAADGGVVQGLLPASDGYLVAIRAAVHGHVLECGLLAVGAAVFAADSDDVFASAAIQGGVFKGYVVG